MKILYHCDNLPQLAWLTRRISLSKALVLSSFGTLSQDEQTQCEAAYIDLVASFASLDKIWWANTFSEKNEHLSSVYPQLTSIYKIIQSIESNRSKAEEIVIVCPRMLWPVIARHYHGQGVMVKKADHFFRDVMDNVIEVLIGYAKLAQVYLKTLKEYFYVRGYAHNFRRRLKEIRNPYVIRTWLDTRFLNAKNNEDAYFGRLGDYIASRGFTPVYVAGIISNYKAILRKLATSHSLIIPEIFFLRFIDLIYAKLVLFWHYLKPIPRRDAKFMGIQVYEFCRHQIKLPLMARDCMMNILRYRMARRMAKELKSNIFLQTFENYAWEKMSILGIKEAYPHAKVYGFQHAFISRNSFKYFPGRGEINFMPLPDKIICMGEVTRKILLRFGTYNENSLTVGCALRQSYTPSQALRSLSTRKLLIPLTMVAKETKTILEFVDRANLDKLNLEIIVRPHPATSFQQVLTKIGLSLPAYMRVSGNARLYDDLQEADMVLYIWSTVALEALNSGLPVIYLNVLGPMFVDPLFECPYLKASVASPMDLFQSVQAMYQMTPQEYSHQLANARDYLRGYFYEVTEKNMEVFVN